MMEWRIWLILGLVSIALCANAAENSLTSGESGKAQHSLQSLVRKARSIAGGGLMYKMGDELQVIHRPGNWSTPYTGVVSRGLEYIYTFNYTEWNNKTTAIRIKVSSPNATVEFPVLFVVRQQRQILSWQVPLMLENIYDYSNVSRTLCPLEPNLKNKSEEDEQVLIDVSSFWNENVTFNLEAVKLEGFELRENMVYDKTVSPSQPQYFMYTFPKDIKSVIVKLESDSEICMVVSVQNTQCPIFDLVRNVEFTGTYQTVTKKSAITLERSYYPSGSFYVVLVVRPSDYECLGIERIVQPGTDPAVRKKNVRLWIEPAISEDQYMWAVLGAVAWFLLFYAVTLIICIYYHFTDHTNELNYLTQLGHQELDNPDLYQNQAVSEREPLLGNHGNAGNHDDTAQPLTSPSEIGPDTPIAPMGGQAGYGTTGASYGEGLVGPYGATGAGPSTSAGFHMQNAAPINQWVEFGGEYRPSNPGGPAEFRKSSNGIPHRIPPPTEVDSEAEEETEYDFVPDADSDKDIFRTKVMLYVADLSRKNAKILSKKYKLYHWNLITISIFYGLPVIQLVVTYQKMLHVTGNEDICYYNFDCAHPLGVLSAFNNVFSNIGYMLLGLLFLILVYRRDIYHKRVVARNEKLDKEYGIPQHFGVFYAAGIALMMEGVLSGCYHVCPSYSNFQFDTSFMYMIAWLLMLKIYQTRHPDINPQAYVAYLGIALVIMVAVIGVVYGTVYFWVLFALFHVMITMGLSVQIYYVGRARLDLGIFQRTLLWIRADCFKCTPPLYTDRMILLIIGNVINWSITIFGLLTQPGDFASFLLSIFMANLLMYFAFYIIMKLRSAEKLLPVPIVFITLAIFAWGCSGYFFFSHLTSWEISPALSREGNQECLLFEFYDAHDIWHFLSSMSLFLSFMILLTIDDDLVTTPRDRIPVF